MFPEFLPPKVGQLTEAASINFAKMIEKEAINTPLSDSAITTTYVNQGMGGTQVLLIHGFDSSVLEFRRLLPLLAENNQTYAVDLLCFGFTERKEGIKYSPTDIKTHLYSFWKSLINKPVILVGASMGGAAAIDFTLTYPEAVEKLVLLDSAGIAGGSSLSKFMFPPLGYLATEFLRSLKVRNRITKSAYKNPELATEDALFCGALHLDMPHWSQALIAFTKSGGYGSFKNQLSQIQQPTLILWGDSDKILGIKDAPIFEKLIPNSKLVWVKDCGHLPHLEQPQITAREILGF
jgi:pimeloyl-ACP methyl ester carboxylesterase